MQGRQAEVEAQNKAHQAEVEAQNKARQAESKYKIKILRMEREETAARAKLKVYEQAMQEGTDVDCSIPIEVEDPMESTSQYVLKHNVCNNAELSSVLPTNNAVLTHHTETPEPQRPAPLQHHNTSASTVLPTNITETPELQKPAPPQHYNAVSLASRSEGSDRSDHARYMICRELLNSSLSKFNDHPETYRSCKATFKATIADLNFNAREELDLLIKWLGPESADRVQGLRTVHIDSPDAGLTAAWARLEQTYGSPEALENALFERLQNFLKIGNKDNYKLQGLSDLLTEIELAKTDPRLTCLSYLDSSHGVNPVVSKLPYGLQEKWTQQGSDYKEQYGVSFPPFSYFCRFISHQAWRRNDPSFHYGEPSVPASSSSTRYVNTAAQHRDSRGAVLTRKTDISPPAPSPPQWSDSGGGDEDPNRKCPIHKKPHPLRKCRELRAMTVQERKEVLQKLGICYRCCASYDHFAKDCKAFVKCTECDNDKHATAMHPAPLLGNPQQPPASNPASNYGREQHGGEQLNHAPVSNVSSSPQFPT
ncbi:uncharacterized protein M6D78_000931 [Vipera latastei]